jgi:hypothetical protein
MGSLTRLRRRLGPAQKRLTDVQRLAADIAPRVIILCVWLCLSAGCSYFNRNASTTSDPLLGGSPVPAQNKITKPATPTTVSVLPPQPAPSASATPASLAAGTPRSLDNNRDLRIGNNTPGTGNDGWIGRDPNPQNNGSGAVLLGVQNSTEVATQPQSPPVYNPVSLPRSQVATYEQAEAILASRGVVWQRLDKVADTGEWEFSCSIPNRQNSRLKRTYIARGPDSLGAIRAVLEQIDKAQ